MQLIHQDDEFESAVIEIAAHVIEQCERLLFGSAEEFLQFLLEIFRPLLLCLLLQFRAEAVPVFGGVFP